MNEADYQKQISDKKRIRDNIKYPVHYDTQWVYIWDNENKMIADVRWWWWIQKQEDAEYKQDLIWKMITFLINKELAPPMGAW